MSDNAIYRTGMFYFWDCFRDIDFMSDIEIVMQARNQTIQDLVDACARGELPFSGPDSLCAKVHAMGYNTNSLYEVVVATKWALNND